MGDNQLTNLEVVTIALAQLGGVERTIHLEEIAERASELAPGAFRWDLDKFANLIDKDKVRVSLTDAEKADRRLVKGVGASQRGKTKRTDFWQVTSNGIDWLMENQTRIESELGAPQSNIKKGRARDLRKRVMRSPLFNAYEADGRVPDDVYALADLVECSPDAGNEVLRDKFEALKAQVRLLSDSDLTSFMDACEETYASLVLSPGGAS